jgi:hypothetical protein
MLLPTCVGIMQDTAAAVSRVVAVYPGGQDGFFDIYRKGIGFTASDNPDALSGASRAPVGMFVSVADA